MDIYGPVLPPGFKVANNTGDESEKSEIVCTASESHDKPIIGPVLPADLVRPKPIENEDQSNDDISNYEADLPASINNEAAIGPSVLPIVQQSEGSLYGPALPPGYHSRPQIIGPTLPPGSVPLSTGVNDCSSDSDSCGEVIGPMPPTDQDASAASILNQFDLRSQRMKAKLSGQETDDKELKRESWMTELPKDLGKKFGLGPRTFSRKIAPKETDTSVWTDTPTDIAKKAAEGPTVLEVDDASWDEKAMNMYNQDMRKRVEEFEHSSKPQETLLEIHQKKLKRKMKEESDKPTERRAFDRDIDLKANQFDAAQRDALIKKSRQLNDRFSHGKGQFL